jgi:hypothetical protein
MLEIGGLPADGAPLDSMAAELDRALSALKALARRA